MPCHKRDRNLPLRTKIHTKTPLRANRTNPILGLWKTNADYCRSDPRPGDYEYRHAG